MPERTLSIPRRILITGTRGALGIGVGLWLSRKISRAVRRGTGGSLLAINVTNTVNVTNTFPIEINIATKPDSRREAPAA